MEDAEREREQSSHTNRQKCLDVVCEGRSWRMDVKVTVLKLLRDNIRCVTQPRGHKSSRHRQAMSERAKAMVGKGRAMTLTVLTASSRETVVLVEGVLVPPILRFVGSQLHQLLENWMFRDSPYVSHLYKIGWTSVFHRHMTRNVWAC
ncbi:uncharacterized protein LOC144871403 isoform X2 [Branchiostoma floridae x Branchiostoma japonicum]